ncbi:hypothetical protein M9H77_11720 [Catharanthus roseus]|uniref:Uncharacterized protein n=1 Tax=Catharanthus roseus TaxID=4058 RepID=A0ACC0BFB4_CATRO|nr:hypothetical protein M9H77_11720 [Catharanthus roseus]
MAIFFFKMKMKKKAFSEMGEELKDEEWLLSRICLVTLPFSSHAIFWCNMSRMTTNYQFFEDLESAIARKKITVRVTRICYWNIVQDESYSEIFIHERKVTIQEIEFERYEAEKYYTCKVMVLYMNNEFYYKSCMVHVESAWFVLFYKEVEKVIRHDIETIVQLYLKPKCGHIGWLCDGTKVTGNLVNPEESVITSCDMEVQLRKVESIRKANELMCLKRFILEKNLQIKKERNQSAKRKSYKKIEDQPLCDYQDQDSGTIRIRIASAKKFLYLFCFPDKIWKIHMHSDHKDDINNDSIYSDEEVSYEELQDKYSLKDSLKKLKAQIKGATERVNVTKGKIARLNTRKAKLDEIISMGRPAGMKSGLGYSGKNLNHTIGTHVTQHESSYTTFGKLEGVFVKNILGRAEKRNLIKKHKLRKPPLMCDYCKMIGHMWHQCYRRIGDLKQGRKLNTHTLTKGEVKILCSLCPKKKKSELLPFDPEPERLQEVNLSSQGRWLERGSRIAENKAKQRFDSNLLWMIGCPTVAGVYRQTWASFSSNLLRMVGLARPSVVGYRDFSALATRDLPWTEVLALPSMVGSRARVGGTTPDPTPNIRPFPEFLTDSTREWLVDRDSLNIIVGKYFDEEVIELFRLENPFRGLGWVPLLRLSSDCYPDLVQEFYTYMLHKRTRVVLPSSPMSIGRTMIINPTATSDSIHNIQQLWLPMG